MEENKNSWLVPVAIVICIVLIGGAVYFKDKPLTDKQSLTASVVLTDELKNLISPAEGVNLSTLRQIDSTDALRGSGEAPVKFIVYTDLECPACKYFHQQLKSIEKDYIDSGKLAIVARDFPLDSLHQKSRAEHLAAACVKDLGGADKFWQFLDKIFEITPSNDGLDLAKLSETAKSLKVDMKKYDDCVNNKKLADSIEKTVQEAIGLGAQGTPFFIITTKNYTIPVFGGYPADRLAQIVDSLIKAESATTTTETPTEVPATTTTATTTEE